jgi:hypothetical protein
LELWFLESDGGNTVLKRTIGKVCRVQPEEIFTPLSEPAGYIRVAALPQPYAERMKVRQIELSASYLSSAVCEHGIHPKPPVTDWPCKFCQQWARDVIGLAIQKRCGTLPSISLQGAGNEPEKASKKASKKASPGGSRNARPGRRAGSKALKAKGAPARRKRR